MRQSHKKIGTLKRKSAAGANKPPPRPTPGSVTYTDDESDKAYDHNPDESSLTEKPSEISSTDSQVRDKQTHKLLANSLIDVFKVGSGGGGDVIDPTLSNPEIASVVIESSSSPPPPIVLLPKTFGNFGGNSVSLTKLSHCNNNGTNSINTSKKPVIQTHGQSVPTKLYPGWRKPNRIQPQMPSPS